MNNNQQPTPPKQMHNPRPLHGSYPPQDVQFLLRLTDLETTPIAEKERMIQRGERHYSQMISTEDPPSLDHQQRFAQALDEGSTRLAREVQMLAKALQLQRPQRPIILVSFVRAGVPLGVLLLHALRDLGVDSVHYGISIIRDKGIDQAALAWIEQHHDFADLIFIDGWVGKGAIHTQLKASLGARYPTQEIPFAVLADPTGKAWLAASADDWLIPFGILGATVSGLISRSILTEDDGWHACMHYTHLADYDVSQAFIARIDSERRELTYSNTALPTLHWDQATRQALQQHHQHLIPQLAKQYEINNLNRLKPGIAEATRAVMRRVPEHILVQDANDPAIRLLKDLANTHSIPLRAVGDTIVPYRALTIIKKTS